jgi:hypothetical protein
VKRKGTSFFCPGGSGGATTRGAAAATPLPRPRKRIRPEGGAAAKMGLVCGVASAVEAVQGLQSSGTESFLAVANTML